jgi:hypothetical protein
MSEMKGSKKGTDRGFVVEKSLPDDPENIRLSKEQFVAKQRQRREKEAKIAEFAKTLDTKEEKKETSKVEAETEAPKEEKKIVRGRPKKIE